MSLSKSESFVFKQLLTFLKRTVPFFYLSILVAAFYVTFTLYTLPKIKTTLKLVVNL